jgi:UDP-3-O-[3-hydroxymyristoyl] glucosamine N-acyltransferase
VARLLGASVVGDPATLLTGLSSLAEAGPGDISFLANPRYEALARSTRAAAILVAAPLTGVAPVQIVVANPDFAFATLVETFGPKSARLPVGIHPTAVIGEGVVIGEGAAIGPCVVIGDGVRIGARCTLHAHVTVGVESVLGADCVLFPGVGVRERCRLGDRVIVHNGAVIGSDGFGYATVQGVHRKIPQVGVVEIGDDVEIGANTTIDRARFGRTVIGKGTKIDNLVQIAHNVEIGEHAIIVAQVGIAGSSKIGAYVAIGGQAGIAGHLEIGPMARVSAQAGVTKSIPARSTVNGTPAQEIKTYQRNEVAVRRMQRSQAEIKDLLARVAELERRLGGAP